MITQPDISKGAIQGFYCSQGNTYPPWADAATHEADAAVDVTKSRDCYCGRWSVDVKEWNPAGDGKETKVNDGPSNYQTPYKPLMGRSEESSNLGFVDFSIRSARAAARGA